MSEEKRIPYLTGVIKDLQGNTIQTIALWINKPRSKKPVETNVQEEQK